MNKVYVVFGTTRDHHREWPVCAFTTERAAQDWVVKCDEEWRRISTDPRYDRYSWDPPADLANKYDPNMQTDYTGTRYYYYEVELREELL